MHKSPEVRELRDISGSVGRTRQRELLASPRAIVGQRLVAPILRRPSQEDVFSSFFIRFEASKLFFKRKSLKKSFLFKKAQSCWSGWPDIAMRRSVCACLSSRSARMSARRSCETSKARGDLIKCQKTQQDEPTNPNALRIPLSRASVNESCQRLWHKLLSMSL